jgi:hypothetical protein
MSARLSVAQVRKWATTRSERSEAGSMAREILDQRALVDARGERTRSAA